MFYIDNSSTEKYSLTESKGSFSCAIHASRSCNLCFSWIYFHHSYFPWPNVNRLPPRKSKSYCKSKRITTISRNKGAKIFFSIFSASRQTRRPSVLSNDVRTWRPGRLFADRKQLTLLNSASLSRRPYEISFDLARCFSRARGQATIYFHSFPFFLSRCAVARAYSKYGHTWYT